MHVTPWIACGVSIGTFKPRICIINHYWLFNFCVFIFVLILFVSLTVSQLPWSLGQGNFMEYTFSIIACAWPFFTFFMLENKNTFTISMLRDCAVGMIHKCGIVLQERFGRVNEFSLDFIRLWIIFVQLHPRVLVYFLFLHFIFALLQGRGLVGVLRC